MNEILKIDKDIIAKARWFCGRNNYLNLEWEDLAQDLRMLLLEKQDSYDKSKGNYLNWAATVMNNHLKDKLKGSFAQKRYPQALRMSDNDYFDREFNGMANYFSDEFKEKYG
jgi:peptidoglycan hydrolase-like amidase